MNRPLVSIILPTHNRAALLPRAVASVRAQSVRDWELVIIDDASSDDTPELCRRLSLDPAIRCLHLARNAGPAKARNIGIETARGRYIGFMDSDDEWLPDKLAIQLQAFATAPESVGLVHCDMVRVCAQGREHPFPTPEVQRGRLVNPRTRDYQVKRLGILSVLIGPQVPRRQIRFDPRLRALEDLELLLRLSQVTDFRAIHQPLVRYHAGAGVSTQFNRVADARRRLLHRYRASFEREPELLAYQYGKIARAYLRGGRTPCARAFAKRAITTAPGALNISLPALAPLLGLQRMVDVAARRAGPD